MMEDLHLLEKPIEQFQASNEFRNMCRINKFKTLNDIVNYRVSKLLEKPEFGMRILLELIHILEKHHLEDFLKD
jgi:DNA-directed RNA polymerase alpha subunit